jgi:hypothetical protein
MATCKAICPFGHKWESEVGYGHNNQIIVVRPHCPKCKDHQHAVRWVIEDDDDDDHVQQEKLAYGNAPKAHPVYF